MEWKIYVNGKLCPIINKGKIEKEENTCKRKLKNIWRNYLRRQIMSINYERKLTELENKIQEIIDSLYAGINSDTEHDWELVFIRQLQDIIYQIWERKANNDN